MPYISQVQREHLEPALDSIVGALDDLQALVPDGLDGALNYTVTKLLLRLVKPKRYADFQRCVGVLECAKLELYRKAAAPYEDAKAALNGEVY